MLVVLAVDKLVEGGHGGCPLQHGGLHPMRKAEVRCIWRDRLALGVLVQHLNRPTRESIYACLKWLHAWLQSPQLSTAP